MDRLNGADHRALLGPTSFIETRPTATPSRENSPVAPWSKAIEVRTPSVARAYAARIATHLERLGHRVRIAPVAGTAVPGTIDWLLWFERLAYRSRGESFAPHVPTQARAAEPCDLVIDLAGDAPDTDTPTVRLTFESGPGEAGLLASLLASRSPVLTIAETRSSARPRILRRAHLAVERPRTLGAALDQVTPRLTTLLGQAVGDLDQDAPEPPSLSDLPPPSSVSPAGFAFALLSERIGNRLTSLLRRPDWWRIAVRVTDGPGVMERLDWSGPEWTVLPGDGRRFFGDPFLFAWKGQRWLFCEEFPYATGKGILVAAPVDDHAAVGAFRPVLETAGHLSWPNVFALDGQVYMIPESAAAGRIELWRAADFPYGWVLDRVLVEGVQAHDPVLHLTDDHALLLATLTDDGGSSCDALGLFRAPDLFGTWQACPGNPLMVDAGGARAAGPIVRRGGELWRATQDCRTAYGDGLMICRITRLDAGGYAHEVVAQLGPPPGLGATGVHTLSRLGNLEAIDLRG